MGHRVAVFNPASNVNQVSRLQVINPCDEAATVRVKGIDDSGASPGTAVEFTVLPDASRMVTSRELESGQGAELVGMLDACMGKWQLVVTSDEPVEVMSLMTNPTGHLTNVSTEPVPGAEGGGAHAVPLFAAAADTDGEVSIEVYDDVGMSFMPVILDVDARETVHVNTGDLEDGNPTKGLAEGIGAGAGVGDWRLALHSSSRCSPTTGLMTGLLAALHDVAPHTGVRRPGANEEVGGRHVAVFYPASNINQVSLLRIVNPGDALATVTVEGIDDAGTSPGTGVELTVPAGGVAHPRLAGARIRGVGGQERDQRRAWRWQGQVTSPCDRGRGH